METHRPCRRQPAHQLEREAVSTHRRVGRHQQSRLIEVGGEDHDPTKRHVVLVVKRSGGEHVTLTPETCEIGEMRVLESRGLLLAEWEGLSASYVEPEREAIEVDAPKIEQEGRAAGQSARLALCPWAP